MNETPVFYFWDRSPFVRLLIPLICGIFFQWNFRLSIQLLIPVFFISIFYFLAHTLFSLKRNFQFRIVRGIFINLLLATAGSILIWKNDIRNDAYWVGNKLTEKEFFIKAVLTEPLSEKANSFKTTATIIYVTDKKRQEGAKGKVVIYFQKDSFVNHLSYGSTILFKNILQPVKNTGNPGSFDFKRYCLFNGITHTAYLTKDNYSILPDRALTKRQEFFYQTRELLTEIIRKYIKVRKESGLAEALLIGYKEDLDKNLLQSYTKTGVVHIIAISGMHLALIYALLLMAFKPIDKIKSLQWIIFISVLTIIWAFTFLCGAQPSILRSSVMLSCTLLANIISRRSSVINSLALSAFILLCYNPFWLWDAGFQLSFSAVLSIVLFFQPIYDLTRFQNKIIDKTWKLCAVSIAAQILTLPIGIYHFHQLPFLFLLSNMIAVPLSGIILIMEIIICALSGIPYLASIAGKITLYLIQFMDMHIERLGKIPFAVWNGLHINFIQVILMIIFIAGFWYWRIRKNKKAFWYFFVSIFIFLLIRSYSFIQTFDQKKLIVFNVPYYQAVEIISGRQIDLVTDSYLLTNKSFYENYLKPSQFVFRIEKTRLLNNPQSILVSGKRIVLINNNYKISDDLLWQNIDYLILSKNADIKMSYLKDHFTIKSVIIDSSVPRRTSSIFKHDLDSLHITYHDVKQEGTAIFEL